MAFSESAPMTVKLSLEPAPSCPLPAWHPSGDAVITIPCRWESGERIQSPSWEDLLGSR